MKKHSLIKVLLLSGLGLWAVGAQASLINLGDSLKISDATGDVNGAGPIAPNLWETGYVNNGLGGPVNQGVYAGAFNVTIVNTTTGGAAFNLLTFCTDIDINWNNTPNNPYTVKSFSSANGVDPNWSASPQAVENAAWIYNQIFVPNESTMVSSGNGNAAAGIQLAIWAALYDTLGNGNLQNGLSTVVSSGNFQEEYFPTAAVTDANNDLNALQTAINNGTFTTYNEYWLDPVNANSQGLIAPVPEPTTLIAGALLLLPFGASTLRILRRNRSV